MEGTAPQTVASACLKIPNRAHFNDKSGLFKYTELKFESHNYGLIMNRKLELLEERKKKWSSSRAMSELTEQVTKESANDVQLTRPDSSGVSRSHSSVDNRFNPKSTPSPTKKNNEADIFLHRLTDKLTEHIRDEMKKEMQMNMKNEDVRDKVAEKMESYLEAELSTHTCKICFELMTSPVHTPILLFPCGHTFCQQCMDTHVGTPLNSQAARNVKATTARKGCPYCRVAIESRAINQSLKDLIDQFSRQQAMVKDRSVRHLDQVFPPRSPPRNTSGNNSNSDSTNYRPGLQGAQHRSPTHTDHHSHTNANSTTAHYVAQLRSCEMRHVILRNEMDEVVLEEELVAKRKTKIKNASDHLSQERDKIDHKISLLQEERDLINKHLAEQKRKQEELLQTELGLKERALLVRNTLNNLQAEMDKLKLLVQGIRGV